MGAVLGTSLYEYLDSHKDDKNGPFKVPNCIDTLIPFSFRQPVKKLEDIKLMNDFAAVGVKLAID